MQCVTMMTLHPYSGMYDSDLIRSVAIRFGTGINFYRKTAVVRNEAKNSIKKLGPSAWQE